MLTYQDYLRYVEQNGLQGAGNYSEQDWNRLSPDRQWANVGGGLMLHNSDPRYQEYAGLLGEKDPGRYLMAGPSGDWDSSWMLDPNRVVSRNGVNVSTSGNESPQSQARNDFGLVQYGWALPLAGAALGALGAFGGAGEAGAGMGAAGEGAGQYGLLSQLPPSTVGSFGPAFPGLGEGAAGLGAAGATGAATGGAVPLGVIHALPAAAEGLGAGEALGLLGAGAGIGALANGHGVNPGDTAPGDNETPTEETPWYQPLLDSPLSSLGRAAGLFQMTRGLLGNGTNSPNPGSTDPGKGGTGQAPQFQRGTYQPNAITQAQLDNFKFARPRGY